MSRILFLLALLAPALGARAQKIKSLTHLREQLGSMRLNPRSDALLFTILRKDAASFKELDLGRTSAFLDFLDTGKTDDKLFQLWKRLRVPTGPARPSNCFLVVIGLDRKDGTYGSGIKSFGHTDIGYECFGKREGSVFFEAGYEEEPPSERAWQKGMNVVRPFRGLAEHTEKMLPLYVPPQHRDRPDAYLVFELRASRLNQAQAEALYLLYREMRDEGSRALNFGPYKMLSNNCNHASLALMNALTPLEAARIVPEKWLTPIDPRIAVPKKILSAETLIESFPDEIRARIDERDPVKRAEAWQAFRARLKSSLSSFSPP